MTSQTFNPTAMVLARAALGMTQTDLAGTTGFTQGAISHWEKGRREPDVESIDRLAEALAVPPTTLTANDFSTAKPMYRTRALQSKRLARKVESRIEFARRAASRIIDEVDLSPALRWPTEDDPLPPEPEAAAEQLRTVWRIPPGPILDLAGHIEAAGGVVLRARFGSEKVDAAYHHPRNDSTRWCLVNIEAHDAARARTTIAHELGHAILHHYDAFNVPEEKVREKEAYAFALALLVPRAEFVDDVATYGALWTDFLDMRQKWGVSAAALTRRARDLGLIAEARYTGLMIYRRRAGHWAWEPGEVPAEHPTTFSNVVALLRRDAGYSNADFASVADTTYDRLADLFPEQFRAAQAPRAALRLLPPS